jgi:hypothetical protein
MARPALRIEVTPKDQKELRRLLSGGIQQVRVVLRAIALLQLAKGVSAPRIAAVIPLTPQAIRKVGHRYLSGGLDRALHEKERPGAATVLEANERQRIIAMVCSDPPEGRTRWTVRLVGRGSSEATTGLTRGKGNHPGFAAPRRPQAAAGKKCGASPSLMRPTSQRWKTCWRRMTSPMIPNSRSYA